MRSNDSPQGSALIGIHKCSLCMRLAHDTQNLSRLPCSVVKINQPDPGAIANHSVGFHPTFVAKSATIPSSEIQDSIPERFGRRMHRLCGHSRPSLAERPAIIAGAIGVRLD